jgi:hypothetical protein
MEVRTGIPVEVPHRTAPGDRSPPFDVGILRGAARRRDGVFGIHAAKNPRCRPRLFVRPALARLALHSAFCRWLSHRPGIRGMPGR